MKTEQLKELLLQMTLEEKLGQLTQLTGEHFAGKMDDEMVETGPAVEQLDLTEDSLSNIGSVLGVSSAKATNLIQKKYLEKSRLKIPLLFMHDAIHGYRTIFPIPLALSCSFDNELLENVAGYIAEELRASGIHVDFSPMTDLVRDARWGRVMESFGEDHILSGRLGKSMIKGYQKSEDGTIGEKGVAACLKHFAAYGAAHGGKDYASTDMSLKEFFGFYAKSYEIALEAKPRFVMSSFNSLNGEPVTASKYLLNDVLREKFKFKDLIISDWGAILELKNHGIAADDKEAAKAALDAGVEIEMVSSTYIRFGKELIEESDELLHKIDQAVLKIVSLKNEMGLLENPYVDEAEESEIILSEKILKLSKEAAIESCVLLKNQDVLPLKDENKKIIVIGPFAKTKELLGNWSCKGKFSETVSLEEGMKEVFFDSQIESFLNWSECSKEVLKEADMIVVTIGESWELSGEGHSSADLEIAEEQQKLLKEIKKLGKKFVCVAFSGRPLALSEIIDDIPALLWCWYPGTCGGMAVAELLAGNYNPSGKLTMSFPRKTGQVPIHYNEYRSGRPANDSSYSSRYQNCEIGPLYAFGHGLSYGTMKYSNIQVSQEKFTDNEKITLTMDILNHSDYVTKETVLLFISDPVSNNVRPVKELLDYKRISFKPQEKIGVEFEITAESLKYINNKLEKVLEKGSIYLYLNSEETPIYEIFYI